MTLIEKFSGAIERLRQYELAEREVARISAQFSGCLRILRMLPGQQHFARGVRSPIQQFIKLQEGTLYCRTVYPLPILRVCWYTIAL